MGNVSFSNEELFEKDVLKSELPVLVYFYSEDCQICTFVQPLVEMIAEKYKGYMKFVKIFRQRNRSLAEKLNIKSSPAILFYKDGQERCIRLNGYVSHSELKNSIDGIIEGYCIGKPKERVHTDVLIIGAGPAGMAAAIYASRAKLMTVTIDEGMIGGQVATTFTVANYPGTNGVIRGMDLMENMKKQAEKFETRVDSFVEIKNIDLSGDKKIVETEDIEYAAKALILATGAVPRKLPVQEEREFRSRGVHYCATCDGALYQDANLIVVGGGNSAVEEAVFLTKYAKKVTVIHQFDKFQATKSAQNELFKTQNIEVIWNSEIREIKGDTFVKSVVVENLKTKERFDMDVDGIFVYIGAEPRTELFRNKVKLDDKGYIIVNDEMKTSVKGVFAAGDVINKKIRQIATAVGDGTVAGIMVERFVNNRET